MQIRDQKIQAIKFWDITDSLCAHPPSTLYLPEQHLTLIRSAFAKHGYNNFNPGHLEFVCNKERMIYLGVYNSIYIYREDPTIHRIRYACAYRGISMSTRNTPFLRISLHSTWRNLIIPVSLQFSKKCYSTLLKSLESTNLLFDLVINGQRVVASLVSRWFLDPPISVE